MDIDQTNEDPRYWNDILNKFGLSMKRGERPNFTTNSGDINNLKRLEQREFLRESGKVEPEGSKPE